jgi:hypothetical protein
MSGRARCDRGLKDHDVLPEETYAAFVRSAFEGSEIVLLLWVVIEFVSLISGDGWRIPRRPYGIDAKDRPRRGYRRVMRLLSLPAIPVFVVCGLSLLAHR